ncbi:MAG TPA: peptidylprolyl isomerase [Flavobacteriales bacterium]|jgi:peptidyl-prolyl cis-trans isomerase SurA|nr:peptidylprolyl isomerase [Flavobacteriales bacterium]
MHYEIMRLKSIKRHIILLVLSLPLLSGIRAQDDYNLEVDKIVAVVADEIILRSQLEEEYLQFARSGQPIKKNSKCVIFEDLLYKKLLLDQAAIDSVVAGEDQIQSELDRRVSYFVEQIGSVEKLEEFYGKSIVEIKEEFHDLIEEQMLIQQMQGQITAGSEVSPKEVKKFFNSIPSDSLPFINSEVVVSHIVKEPNVNQEEKDLVELRLNGIRDRILKGEDFGTLAYLYSEDPGSAKKNGELGFLSRGQLVPEFARVVFSLELGQTSEVFETEYGFHIAQLIERRGQQVNARHILLKPKVNTQDMQKARKELDSLRNYITSNDTIRFEDMALKESDDETTRMNGGKLINPITGTTTFEFDEVSRVDPTLFYVLDKMKPGEISNPVIYQKMDGSQAYRLVYLISVTEPHKASLEKDYQKITSAARAEKEKEIVSDWIRKKIRTTYIRIDSEFEACEFQHDWYK